MASKFILGAVSLRNLQNVKPELVTLAHLALSISSQDFAITCGLRSAQAQQVAVSQGHSQTEHSMHLTQPDGFSHAFDAVPWVDGKPVWDWQYVYSVAAAVHQAATAMGIADNIRWGGAWDKVMSDLGSTPLDFMQATKDYASRHAGPDFLDGPHYEWKDSPPKVQAEPAPEEVEKNFSVAERGVSKALFEAVMAAHKEQAYSESQQLAKKINAANAELKIQQAQKVQT